MMEKGTQTQQIHNLLGIVSQLNKCHTIPSQIFPTYNSPSILLGIHLTSSKRNQ